MSLNKVFDSNDPYNWIPVYKVLADEMLAKIKNNPNQNEAEVFRKNLCKLAESFFNPNGLVNRDANKFHNIDPFSIFLICNSYAGNNGSMSDGIRRDRIKDIFDCLNIQSSFDFSKINFNGVPTQVESNGVLVYKYYDKQGVPCRPADIDEEVNDYWEVFDSAIQYGDNPQDDNFKNDFKSKLNMLKDKYKKSSIVKIVTGLFCARPDFFVSIDACARFFLPEEYGIAVPDKNYNTEYIDFINKPEVVALKSQNNGYAELSYDAYIANGNNNAALSSCKSIYLLIVDNNDMDFVNASVGTRVAVDSRGKSNYNQLKVGEAVYVYNKDAATLIGLFERVARRKTETEGLIYLEAKEIYNEIVSQADAIILNKYQKTKAKGLYKLDDQKVQDIQIINNKIQNVDNSSVENPVETIDETINESQTDLDISYALIPGRNIIYSGVPGCGKSYRVDNEDFVDYSNNGNYETSRVVFYIDYTYTDFVGQVMPKTINGKIIYEFVPGPFTRMLEKALYCDYLSNNGKTRNFALIIEEINRGNAAAIFGDIFQLLDRGEDGGQSKYSITNSVIYEYLTQKSQYKEALQKALKDKDKIYIPKNLSLVATMNTTDQNLFVLDSAFTRRWEKIWIKNDLANCKIGDLYVPLKDYTITWSNFAKIVNAVISNSSRDFGNEDKVLGAYFVNKNCLLSSADDEDFETKRENFAYKVLHFLWADALKFNNRKNLFDLKDIRSFEDLLIQFVDKEQDNIFNEDILEKMQNTVDTEE